MSLRKPLMPAVREQDVGTPEQVRDVVNRLVRRLEESRREDAQTIDALEQRIRKLENP